jgi:protoheme IX farnesyltransferase
MTTATTTDQLIEPAALSQERGSLVAALIVLFKLRVVLLLLFAAFGGAMLGSAGAPTWGELGLLLLTGFLSASGASALNQYLERHKDGAMKRTRRRPLVTGQIHARWVLVIGSVMVAAASGIALLARNPALAIWLAVGAFIYVGIYTLWLKPRSVLNVVIGGAAGSAAVLSGGAAVGAWSDSGVLLLALLLFTWSPTHFWSLALAYRADYARAGVPMLPVIASPRRAAFWMLAHTVATVAFGLLLALHGALGWLYLIPVALVTVWWLVTSGRLITHYTGAQALRAFKVSNLYLSLVLLVICVVTLV